MRYNDLIATMQAAISSAMRRRPSAVASPSPMTGVPSVVFGLFVYIVLVVTKIGGTFAGWKGSVALALLMLPVVTRTALAGALLAGALLAAALGGCVAKTPQIPQAPTGASTSQATCCGRVSRSGLTTPMAGRPSPAGRSTTPSRISRPTTSG